MSHLTVYRLYLDILKCRVLSDQQSKPKDNEEKETDKKTKYSPLEVSIIELLAYCLGYDLLLAALISCFRWLFKLLEFLMWWITVIINPTVLWVGWVKPLMSCSCICPPTPGMPHFLCEAAAHGGPRGQECWPGHIWGAWTNFPWCECVVGQL